MLQLNPVPFSSIIINDSFWSPKLAANQRVTLQACLDRCRETGRVANFDRAAGLEPGGFQGISFDDSDVYKVLEGVAYSLKTNRDADLERQADAIIGSIAAAQREDGYLFTYNIINGLENRWTDMAMHEDYCLGHLIEAAVAYTSATGKRTLLDTAIRFADHFDSLFGPGKRHWVTGHEELELALVKLCRATGESRYLRLAQWLVEERGHGHGAGEIWDNPQWGARQCQDDRPVRQMTDITGHAVRAMYLYAGMADVAREAGDETLLPPLGRLWESVALRNMYITGGIGSSHDNEGFTKDYDLPNEEAYCETCASAGMVFWNHRMNLLTGDAKYADVMERALYNGALAGVSLDGSKFFYVNPLASNGSHHRKPWYGCACCPSQIARFLPSVGNYLYAVSEEGLWVNLFVSGLAEFDLMGEKAVLRQQTGYPWNGDVSLRFEKLQDSRFTVSIRKPGWCAQAEALVNGEPVEIMPESGYFRIFRQWSEGDEITVRFAMKVTLNHAHPAVRADIGRVALMRGPLVYCFEQCDNPGAPADDTLDEQSGFDTEWREDLPGGYYAVAARAGDGRRLAAVPYFAWDNREAGWMRVWMRESPTLFSPIP